MYYSLLSAVLVLRIRAWSCVSELEVQSSHRYDEHLTGNPLFLLPVSKAGMSTTKCQFVCVLK